MKFRGGEFSTGTTGNFQPELTLCLCFVLRIRGAVMPIAASNWPTLSWSSREILRRSSS